MAPFIFRFETENCQYIYDVNTNKVFAVDLAAYSIIEDYGTLTQNEIIIKYRNLFTEEELLAAWNDIQQAAAGGFFQGPLYKEIGFGETMAELVEKSKCEHMIINVTENCNLRCSYCVYSGVYDGRRPHSEKVMTEETAFKAAGYFIANRGRTAYMSFYGGEPLLAIALIRKIVKYLNEHDSRPVKFSMTTNGMLLNEEIMDFLAVNEFNVTISLDGPREIHDRYRKTPAGGGTWETIYENLITFREKYPEYYRTRVGFTVVNAPPVKLDKVAEFFMNNPVVKENRVNNSAVEKPDRNIFPDGGEERSISIKEIYKKAYLQRNKVPKFFVKFYEDDLVGFYQRHQGPIDSLPLNGCCIPGTRRLFVSSDGGFFVCEKMDSGYSIGNLTDGLDLNRIKTLIEQYSAMSEDCLNCWACRLCGHCFASFMKNGGLNEETRRRACKNMKINIEDEMVLYYSLIEKDSGVFDHFSTYEKS